MNFASTVSKKINKAGEIFFESKWLLPHSDFVICRNSWGSAYGFRANRIEKVSANLKINANATEDAWVWNEHYIAPYDYNQIGDFIHEYTKFVDLDDELIINCLTPRSERQQNAILWLQNCFRLYAEKAPNSTEIHLSINSKRDVYKDYVEEMTKKKLDFVEECNFVQLWNAIFPNYMIRPWIAIPGKCQQCGYIQDKKKLATNRAVQEALRQCHTLHRGGLFMPERKQYRERIDRALNNPDTIMSCILDGMDQNHSRMPYLGRDNSMNDTLVHHIQGVLVHGQGVTFYETYDNLSKGANLTLHCFLKELEKWKDAHEGNYPEEVYLQVDGGSENANRTVLAWCEYLCAKKLINRVWYTRLPAGHTHEDIDATFAVIWKWMRDRSVYTLDQYKFEVEKAFSTSKLHASVVPVYVIADYETAIEPFIDPNFGKFAKQIDTQHQWLFTAVEPSISFPLGVKTLYRAYSSDKVVELQKRAPGQELSAIAQLTGLEPVTVYVQWYPTYDTYPETRKGIQGFSLLIDMPRFPPCPEEDHWFCNGHHLMPPVPFTIDCGNSFSKVMLAIRKEWQPGESCRDWWDSWYERICPQSATAEEYVEKFKHAYHIPNSDAFHPTYACKRGWTKSLQKFSGDLPNIVFPEVLALAQASVASRFQRNPGPSRIYSLNTEELMADISRYTERTKSYEIYLQNLNVSDLQEILRRRTKSTGEVPTLGGSKESIVKRILISNQTYIKHFYRRLIPENLHYVNELLSAYVETESDLDKPVTTLETIFTTKKFKLKLRHFRQLHYAVQIGPELLDFAIAVLQFRDDQLCKAHYDVTGKHQKSSYFATYNFYSRLNAYLDKSFPQNARDHVLQPEKVTSLYRLYIPYRKGVGANIDDWAGIMVCFDLKIIYYIDSKMGKDYVFTQCERDFFSEIEYTINTWLLSIKVIDLTADDDLWSCVELPPEYRLFQTYEYNYESGVFVIAAFDCLYHLIPVQFHQQELYNYRCNLGYSLLKTEMFKM